MAEKLPAYLAVEIFRGFDPHHREDVVGIMGGYEMWSVGVMTLRHLKRVPWYVDCDSRHVSRFLTLEGSDRLLGNVASNYVNSEGLLRKNYPNFFTKIEQICEAVKTCELPPIIVVKGRNPFKPWYLIDGVHRSLAYCVSTLREQVDEGLKVPVMMGTRTLLS